MKTKLKILHLEDSATDAELVERELKKGNIQFEKLVVGNKAAFEKALKEFDPEIVLTDHTLPSFDSLEAIKMMKQKGIKIPIILVSATVSDEYAVEVMKAGADDYILKDRLHRLPQAVLNAMEKFSRDKERERMIYDQAHLAAIISASNDGIISKTLDGTITSWNLSAEKLFGYSATEAIGKNISIIIPLECLKEESEFMESIKRGESIEHFETKRLKKNGSRLDVSLTISPINDNNGKVIGAAKIVHDITERKKTEQIIYDSEEKYFSLFENSMDAIMLTITDGNILAANPAACTMFGMSEEEICTAGRFGIVDTKDPRLTAALEERRRTGKGKAEITAIRKNGERFPGEFTSVVYKNANGEERTSLIVRDITERKHAEEEITKLSLVARKTSNAVVITDAEEKIQWVNDAFTRMTGFELNEIIGKRPGTFLQGPETDQEVVSYMRRKIRKRKAFECDIINYTKSGNKFWTNIKCQPEFDSIGKLTGFFSIQSDITKDKEAEKAIYELTERMTLAANSAKIGIWEWDVVNNHLIWDKIMYQIFGVAEDKFGGAYEEWEAIVHPDDIEEENAKVQSALSGGAKFDSECRILWPDKSIRYIKGDAIVVRDDTGKPLRMIGTNFDITEKKRLEKAVKTERDQFFEMFSKAPSAIGMLKGANHVFEMANPLYLQLTGKKDIIGKTVAEVLPEVIEQGFVSMLDHVYQTGESHTGTEELVEVDTEGNGEFTDFYINFVYQAYRNGEGNIEGIFFFINDVTEQIVSKKKIEKSEKFFKGVIENSADMITLTDAAGKTIYASPAVTKNFGYSYEECLEMNIADIVHPDDALKMQEFFEKIMMHPGVPIEVPLIRDRKKDGSYMWVEGTATNFLEAEGINAIVANFRDITEKKKADEEIRFKANLLNTIGQSAIATDLNGIVNYWNQAAEKIYGWTREEAIGKDILHLTISHKTREQALEMRDDLKNGRSWSGEFKGQHKDGTSFPAFATISPIYNENNKLSGIIGISSDITERKKLEALLDKSNRLARIGSWEIDVAKGTVFWSVITKEIFEADSDFIPDLHIGRQMTKEGRDRNILSKRIEDCIEKEIPWDEELQFTTFKGNLKWVRTIGEAEFVQGKCIKVYGSFQDITERKNAESERTKMISDIVQRNSDLEQFSYIVSHNLRAPVANILGLGDLIDNKDYTLEVKNNFLDALLDNVKRLDVVISDLNSILQVKSKIDTKKEKVILNELVESIQSSIQNLIEKEKAEFTTNFDVPAIHTVQSYLHSIFYNLIVNSIKYHKPGVPPQIVIRSELKEGAVVLSFEDNGMGIDLVKKREEVFGLYKRFHHHIEGKGMGLFLVKTQVELLGGKISIESEVNAGTKFTITIEKTTLN